MNVEHVLVCLYLIWVSWGNDSGCTSCEVETLPALLNSNTHANKPNSPDWLYATLGQNCPRKHGPSIPFLIISTCMPTLSIQAVDY